MHFKTERIILNVDIKHYECDWQCTGLITVCNTI